MNKKLLLSIVIIVILLLGSLFYLQKNNPNNGSNTNIAAYAHEQFKKSCTLFDSSEYQEHLRIYKNDIFNISFEYPTDMLVCARPSPISLETNSIEVSVWKKDDFHSAIPQFGPFLVIHVDNNDITELPQPVTLKEETKNMGGVNAIVKQVRAPSCTDSGCPIFTLYEIKHNGHTYLIEERKDLMSVIESFRFLKR